MAVLVTGSSGFLGSEVLAELLARGRQVVGAARSPARDEDVAIDLAQAGSVERLLTRTAPEAVVHCAAVPDIAPCREDPNSARRLNAEVPGELAAACAETGLRLVHVSTDQVFDGSRGNWTEQDEPAPLHVYGETKAAGERQVLARCPAAAIVRPGLITGLAPAGRRSASSALAAALEAGRVPRMFTDEIRSPVASVDVARALADLVEQTGLSGLFHCGGPEALSRHALARREAAASGFDASAIAAGTRIEAGLAEERPANLSLCSDRLVAALGWVPRALAAG